MNAFKKSLVAILAISTVAGATVSTAHAGGKWWKKSLATGVGVGVGLGIVGAVTRPRSQTVIVHQQPQRQCWVQPVTVYGVYGPYTQNQTVCR